MIYVEVYFKQSKKVEEKPFSTPYNALRFMYAMRSQGNRVLSYRCDDPYENEFINRRFKL